ncbi:unnamed protein product [Calicophoron daubneyi]|uniref:CUB domain-containing protein n=1 Tax=Calicophoron daubneyi TaxID=300641 RepID=A0AAV2TD13_CALDB
MQQVLQPIQLLLENIPSSVNVMIINTCFSRYALHFFCPSFLPTNQNQATFYPGRAISPSELPLPIPPGSYPSCRFRIEATSTDTGEVTSNSDELSGTSGELVSPTYPGFHPDGLVCAYQLIGLPSQRINVDVIDLNLPEQSSTCDRGFLAVYGSRALDGIHQFTEPPKDLAFDPEGLNIKPDQIWCDRDDQIKMLTVGKSLDSTPIVGRQSLLLMRLNASGVKSPGLKASFRVLYKFGRDFGIPGAPVDPETCRFVYAQTSQLLSHIGLGESGGDGRLSKTYQSHDSGWTNSPNYPNNYPPNIMCIYVFVPKQGTEYIRLSFGSFDTQQNDQPLENTARSPLARNPCDQDFLEIAEIHLPLNDLALKQILAMSSQLPSSNFEQTNWVKQWQEINDELRSQTGVDYDVINSLAVYCGTQIPGPVISSRFPSALVARFYSDQTINLKGFTLHYEFLDKSSTKVCGSNNSAGESGGLIETPNFPNAYPSDINCAWYLQGTSTESQIQLHFEHFNLEGSERDCSKAVVRVFEGGAQRPAFELCGNYTNMPPLITSSSSVVIRFHTVSDNKKANGFRLIWNELLAVGSDGHCDGFRCLHTKLCIPKSLECNGLPNCGAYTQTGNLITDNSDELAKCSHAISYNFVHIGLGVLLTFVLLLGLAGFIYYRERKRRKKLPTDPLAELTGSRHSLTSSHMAVKAHGHSTIRSRNHTHVHSHHNSRSHIHVDGDPFTKLSQSSSNIHAQSRRKPHSYDRGLLPGPDNPSKVGHSCASRHQLVSVKELQRGCSINSARLPRRPQRSALHRAGSLHRNGGLHTGSSTSIIVAPGSGLSDADGGFFIREKMQKISIV